jgi:signal transduction histidine kinase
MEPECARAVRRATVSAPQPAGSRLPNLLWKGLLCSPRRAKGERLHQPLPEYLATGGIHPAVRRNPWWPVGSRRSYVFLAALLAVVMGGTSLALALASGHLESPTANAVLRPYVVVAPILIGLAWKLRRPDSRFGLLLIALGMTTWPLSWQAANQPLWYSLGVVAGDPAVVVVTFYVALAFPIGHLGTRLERLVMVLITLAMAARIVWTVSSPVIEGGGVLSRCGDACPPNALYVAAPTWLPNLAYSFETLGLLVATSLAIVVFARRLAIAPRPRRRALITVGLTSLVFFPMFLLFQMSRRLLELGPVAEDTTAWIQAILRFIYPLGFAIALVQADLFAGRALRQLLERLTYRPSPERWRDTVAEALDDPTLRIGYWDPDASRYREASGDVLEPSEDPGHTIVTVDHNGVPVAAIEVDAILRTDPELLGAAANATLLAVERGTLEGDLRASQKATLEASDIARRRIARDLHDSVQQRLVALRLHLLMAQDGALEPKDREILERFGSDVDQALGDIRAVARGTHVAQLHRDGLESALRAAIGDRTMAARFAIDEVLGVSPDVEDAIYFVVLEALQNVAKHAGDGVTADVVVRRIDGEVVFSITDDGRGFDPGSEHGLGLDNMSDRTTVAGGRLEIASDPARGTTVTGRIPLGDADRA